MLGTPSVARDSSRAESNSFQALCDAEGNSASSYREWTCLKARAGAFNERNSNAANVCSIGSRNLNRCRNRTLGRSKKIPDISRSLCLLTTTLQVEGVRLRFESNRHAANTLAI